MIHNKDKTPYEQRAPVEVCMLDWWLEMPARRDYLRILENEFHVNWRYQ